MNRVMTRGCRLLAAVGTAAGLLALGAGTASAAPAETVYSNLANPMPGNYASIGFAATSTSEYGGEIELAGTQRKNPIVTVAMSAWACEYGNWETNTCATPNKKKFKWPLTVNIYAVGPGGSVGAKLGSDTREARMPYRPSVSAKCAKAPYEDPGAWYDEATNECFHGFAFPEKFRFPGVTLPSDVIISVAYDTSNYGEHPAGDATACYESPQGCYYDSLNVAVVEPSEDALTTGSDPTESQYVDSNWNEMYCGSSASLDTFGPSGVCPSFYEGDQPVFQVEAH
jgi:hypothetical protein